MKPIGSKNIVFAAGEFVTSSEKETVYRDWRRFVAMVADTGVTDECPKSFSVAIYHQLHQYGGFSAHYDRHGFWSEQLSTSARALKFFASVMGGISRWGQKDFRDINLAMIDEVSRCWETIRPRLEKDRRAEAVQEIRAIAAAAGLVIDDVVLLQSQATANQQLMPQGALF